MTPDQLYLLVARNFQNTLNFKTFNVRYKINYCMIMMSE